MSTPDFSHQNLRSHSFKDKVLRGVSFSYACCGVSIPRAFLGLLISAVIGVLLGLFMFVGALFPIWFAENILDTLSISSDGAWLWGVTALLTTAYCGVVWLFFYRGLISALIGLVVIAGAGTVAGAAAVAIYFIFCYFLAWRAVWKEDPQLAFMRQLALNFGSWGGTNFSRADLSEADFRHAELKRARFDSAILTRTNFQHAKNLKFAWLKNTILDNRAVRDWRRRAPKLRRAGFVRRVSQTCQPATRRFTPSHFPRRGLARR